MISLVVVLPDVTFGGQTAGNCRHCKSLSKLCFETLCWNDKVPNDRSGQTTRHPSLKTDQVSLQPWQAFARKSLRLNGLSQKGAALTARPPIEGRQNRALLIDGRNSVPVRRRPLKGPEAPKLR
jgi:hypothetical protein